MKLEDILTKKEIEEYHGNWKPLTPRDNPEHEYTVHSGLPVIGRVYQYKDKTLFRAHVFQKKLRKFDPYFITPKYVHPFWHALHYFIVMEQVYHASSNIIRDNSKLVGRDVPEKFEWRRPLSWDDRVSVELILEDLGKHGFYLKERGNFTFYNDKKKSAVLYVSVLTYWKPRNYIRAIEKIKNDKKDIKELTKKIERQDMNLKRLINSRKHLKATKVYLLSELKIGNIPEEELHDFFSLWDPPPKNSK